MKTIQNVKQFWDDRPCNVRHSKKEIGTKELKSLYNQNIFQEGTIKPKIKAALHFLKHHKG